MAKMKWIYSMVQDGTYTAFKQSQIKAKKDKIQYFIWDGQKVDVNFAHFVCEYVDKFVNIDYEAHIEREADRYSTYKD